MPDTNQDDMTLWAERATGGAAMIMKADSRPIWQPSTCCLISRARKPHSKPSRRSTPCCKALKRKATPRLVVLDITTRLRIGLRKTVKMACRSRNPCTVRGCLELAHRCLQNLPALPYYVDDDNSIGRIILEC